MNRNAQRSRALNFSINEVEVLLKQLIAKREQIYGSQPGKAWAEILREFFFLS